MSTINLKILSRRVDLGGFALAIDCKVLQSSRFRNPIAFFWCISQIVDAMKRFADSLSTIDCKVL